MSSQCHPKIWNAPEILFRLIGGMKYAMIMLSRIGFNPILARRKIDRYET